MNRIANVTLALVVAGHIACQAESNTQTQTVTLPDGNGTVTITTTGEGKPHVEVTTKGKKVEPDARPPEGTGTKVAFLGVGSEPVSPDLAEHLDLPKGVYIAVGAIQKGSPADKAGLKVHDILTHLDDQILINPAQFQQLVRMKKSGNEVSLKFIRAGKEQAVKATLSEHEVVDKPEPQAPSRPGRREEWGPSAPIDPFWGPGLDPGAFQEHFRRLQEDMMRNQGQNPAQGGNYQQNTFTSRSSMQMNERGKFTFSEKDGEKSFKAEDPAGKILFDGPVDTEEDRAKVPEEVRDMLHQMEGGQGKPNMKYFRKRQAAEQKGQAI